MADVPDQGHCYYGIKTTVEIGAIIGMDAGDTVWDSTVVAQKVYDGANWILTGGPPGIGNTLDQAYDQGGAGAGRTITADAGALRVHGVGGIESGGDIVPKDTDTQNLGSPTKVWNNIYSGDVILMNRWRISEVMDEEGNMVPDGGVVIKNKKGESIFTITNDGLWFKGVEIA